MVRTEREELMSYVDYKCFDCTISYSQHPSIEESLACTSWVSDAELKKRMDMAWDKFDELDGALSNKLPNEKLWNEYMIMLEVIPRNDLDQKIYLQLRENAGVPVEIIRLPSQTPVITKSPKLSPEEEDKIKKQIITAFMEWQKENENQA